MFHIGNTLRVVPRAGTRFQMAGFSELGRFGEALGPAEEAVGLFRGLADPVTGNPERYGSRLRACPRLVYELLLAIEDQQEPPAS